MPTVLTLVCVCSSGDRSGKCGLHIAGDNTGNNSPQLPPPRSQWSPRNPADIHLSASYANVFQ